MSMPDSATILRTEGAWSSGAAGAACRPVRLAPRARPVRLGAAPARRGSGGLALARCRGGGRCGSRRRGDAIGLGDHPEHGADLDGGAGGGADLAQTPAGAGIDLQRHLVGLELEQRLVALDGIAHRLDPFGDGRLGHGFAEGGDDDIGWPWGSRDPSLGG